MPLPDGIFLNLPSEAYLADSALGSSDLKELLLKPVQWHGKKRNPVWRQHLQPKGEKANASGVDQAFGTALHAAILEPDAFDERYLVEPKMPDWPKTIDQIRVAIETSGNGHFLPSKSAPLSHHQAAARAANIKTADDWQEELELLSAGRIRISAAWKFELLTLQRVLERHSVAPKWVRGGRSEVSVFFTDEHGHRYKCRFDHLRQRTCADIKTYGIKDGLGPVDSFIIARDSFAYDFSAVHYMDIRMNALPALVAAGAVFQCMEASQDNEGVWHVPFEEAAENDMEFMRRCAAWDKPVWAWVACAKFGVPEVDLIEFPDDLMAYRSAQFQLEVAKQNYRDMRAKFGDDDSEMWSHDRGHIRLTDFNFSPRATGRAEVRYETI